MPTAQVIFASKAASPTLAASDLDSATADSVKAFIAKDSSSPDQWVLVPYGPSEGLDSWLKEYKVRRHCFQVCLCPLAGSLCGTLASWHASGAI